MTQHEDRQQDRPLIYRDEVDRRFVTLDRYLPVERLVYGLVALVAAALIGVLVTLLQRGNP